MWGLNLGLGNNGSSVHRLFFRFSQGFAIVPFMNLAYIYNIKHSYLINEWFAYYSAATTESDEYVWAYDPTEDTTTSPHYYDA